MFEEAHGGTLFLDEVGELSPRAQAKLLRVIQEGELRRVGENVVAAGRRAPRRGDQPRSARQEVAAGRFRHDLLYRLDVIRIAVPPLRDRPRRHPAAGRALLARGRPRASAAAPTLATATLAALARYDWPGNVRELQNVLAALAVARRGAA